MDGYAKFFLSIGRMMAIGSMFIALLLLIIDSLKLIIIENKLIMTIIIFGIVSQILLITITLYVRAIVNRQLREIDF